MDVPCTKIRRLARRVAIDITDMEGREVTDAKTMTREQLIAALDLMGDQWDAFRSDIDEGHGGSPGEWMVERMDELETELRRRQTEATARANAEERSGS